MVHANLKLVSAVCVVVVIVAASFIFSRGTSARAEALRISDATTFNELSEKFTVLAKERGAAFAFDVLRIAPLPGNADVHLIGHAIGDVLYSQEGINGIQICTQEFRNACSHAIVVGALQEFGEQALASIRDACNKAPGGSGAYTMCFHGLGHGVFAGYGYDLAKTIAFCKKTGTPEHRDREYIECVGGAIMELVSGGGHDHERWEAARTRYLTAPLAPCLSAIMPDDVQEICLTYLTPELWARAGLSLATPDTTRFGEAFSYCDAIPHAQQKLRDACFGGFGKEFVPYAAARDIRSIDAMSDEHYSLIDGWCSEAQPLDGRKACIREALASVFWGGENDPHAALRFCALVQDPDERMACYSKLSTAVGNFITDMDVRRDVCASVPVPLRPHCLRAAIP